MNKLEKKLKKEEENQKRIENKINAIIFPSYVDYNDSKDSFIKLKNINKVYDNNVQAVFDFNLNINQKEFIVFVGPSGCGKSTTLRMICGLEEISFGGLFIDGVYANELSPKNRDIAMVFQSYALYPHMSVYDNLAFSLKIRKVPVNVLDSDGKPVMAIDKRAIKACEKRIKELHQIIKEDNAELVNLDKNAASYNETVLKELKSYYHERNQLAENQISLKENELNSLKTTPREKYIYKHLTKAEIDEKIKKVSKILQIEQFLNRKPKALSGGQRQRVALGRAIVRDAKVFLMDEPLSNLDAKLRVAMRAEIVDIHRKIDATTIYVTHDQTEAMTMADRIVVMKDGVVQQIGSPKDIYNNPHNLFVATFIGSPAMNILKAKLCGDHVSIGNSVHIDLNKKVKIEDYYNCEINRLESIKDNLINALNDTNDKNRFIYEKALERVNDLSSILSKKVDNKFDILFGIRPEQVHIVDENEPFDAIVKAEIVELLGSEYQIHTHIGEDQLIIKSQTNKDISVGDEIKVSFDVAETLYFDIDTQQRIY